MITLYAPEPPKPPHTCETDMYVGLEPPRTLQGAIIACKTCGGLWYADVRRESGSTPYIHTVFWRKVRWYHFDLKKKARENG